jgi:hypothetical protein
MKVSSLKASKPGHIVCPASLWFGGPSQRRVLSYRQGTPWSTFRVKQRRIVTSCIHTPLRTYDEERIPGAVGRIHRGRRTVSVAQTGGSVGRCSEFDRDFMPAKASVEERWKRW